MPAQIIITLSDQERIELEKDVSSRMAPVRLVRRAKAIPMAADKIPSYKIAEELGVSSDTIGCWRRRYAKERMNGIVKDRPRGANHGESIGDNPLLCESGMAGSGTQTASE